MKPAVPANVYVCMAGHLTEADEVDEAVRVVLGCNPDFDYTQFCRRKLTAPDGGGWSGPGSLPCWDKYNRCHEHVVSIAKFPELYAAFLLGGESAVAEIVIGVVHGTPQQAQGKKL